MIHGYKLLLSIIVFLFSIASAHSSETLLNYKMGPSSEKGSSLVFVSVVEKLEFPAVYLIQSNSNPYRLAVYIGEGEYFEGTSFNYKIKQEGNTHQIIIDPPTLSNEEGYRDYYIELQQKTEDQWLPVAIIKNGTPLTFIPGKDTFQNDLQVLDGDKVTGQVNQKKEANDKEEGNKELLQSAKNLLIQFSSGPDISFSNPLRPTRH